MSEATLAWQDEILQILYWMRGENLGEEASAEQINRLLTLEPAQMEAALGQLIRRGLVETARAEGEERFRLTEGGLEEGKRRFAEEFSSYLGRESHLTCDDPSCDCHAPEWSGACPSAGG